MRRSESTPLEGTHCTVTGWGYTENVLVLAFGGTISSRISVSSSFFFKNFLTQDQYSDISNVLLKTDVDVIDINFCNGSYSYTGAMLPGMFCAGNINEGSPEYIFLVVHTITIFTIKRRA